MTTITQNKKLIECYFYEVWNEGRLDLLDEIMAEDYINHSPGAPNPPPGPKGLKPIIQAIKAAFPDLHYEIKNLVIAEEQVAAHTIMSGTHAGDFFGIPPTGKNIAVMQMQIERIKNGKIVEHWRLTDDLSLLRQLDQIK